MSDVSRLPDAGAAVLLPLVYAELRELAAARMAAEAPGHTLQATALVHQAYLRLVNPEPGPLWGGRGHFFAAAGKAMRRIIVASARRKKAANHGGGPPCLDLVVVQQTEGSGPWEY